jgi:hypothetical protein
MTAFLLRVSLLAKARKDSLKSMNAPCHDVVGDRGGGDTCGGICLHALFKKESASSKTKSMLIKVDGLLFQSST